MCLHESKILRVHVCLCMYEGVHDYEYKYVRIRENDYMCVRVCMKLACITNTIF